MAILKEIIFNVVINCNIYEISSDFITHCYFYKFSKNKLLLPFLAKLIYLLSDSISLKLTKFANISISDVSHFIKNQH